MNVRATALLLAAAVALATAPVADAASKCSVSTPTTAPATTTAAPVATTAAPVATTAAPATTTAAPATTTAAPATTTAAPATTTAAPTEDEDDDSAASEADSDADDESDTDDTTTTTTSSTTSSSASSTASSSTSSTASSTAEDADDTTTSTTASTATSTASSASTTGSTTASGSGTGLHVAASAAGKYMGTASDLNTGDSYYTAELANANDWGMVTPGNAMKWDSTEPTQNSFSYTKADTFVQTVQAAGMKVRCHTLCWYQQTPTWVQSLSKEDMLSALENHITEVMTHFGDDCYAWDVVNEALNEDGTYRASFWYNTTGTEYITTAFKTANSVKESLGLSTKLYYNDYNTDSVNSKSTGALALAQMLLDANITIDGMGFQSHLTSGTVASTADQVTNLERFTAIGLEVAITELDIKVGTSSPTDAQLKQQATDYASVVSACKQVDGCVGVTTWDFSDQYSWISGDAPLPFDQPGGTGTAVEAKAAYDSILSAWSS